MCPIIADGLHHQFKFKLGGQLVSSSEAEADAQFTEKLKEFEEKHPGISVEELVDLNKQLPDDTSWAKAVNQVKKKNLVTIEQTWA